MKEEAANKDKKEQMNEDSVFEKYLRGLEGNLKQTQKRETEDAEYNRKKKQEIITNANNWFLVNILSPEIQSNEKRKRQHKDCLMILMGAFLLFQFFAVAVMVGYSGYHIIEAHFIGEPFADSTIKIIFTFIGTYITSVIVELIAILNYIVKNVFDTSVAGMVNNFKENIKDDK